MEFPVKWRNWISGVLSSAKSSVLVNGSPTFEFRFQRGIRQGDPLSPFLFILGMEAFTKFLDKLVEDGLFKGFSCPNNGPSISHLLFADDALLLGEWSKSNVKNMSRFLRIFHLVSGLKINLAKSKLFGVGVQQDEVSRFAGLIGCRSGSLPTPYLGMIIGANMNKAAHWSVVLDAFDKRLSLWKKSVLSVGGRLTLLKSVMETLPTYFFSIFKAPVKIIEMMEARRRRFFWGCNEGQHKINWIGWDNITKPKEDGGLGLTPLREINIALLTKWWWRFKTEENALWRRVICSLHHSNRSWPFLPFANNLTGTWNVIAKLDNILAKSNIKLPNLIVGKLGNGGKIRFWLDSWIGSQPLKEVFPRLFALAKEKGILVKQCFEVTEGRLFWKWSWKRTQLVSAEEDDLIALTDLLKNTAISNVQDEWIWKADPSKKFSVLSMKKVLQEVAPQNDIVALKWNGWIPKKANIFLWKALNNRIPTVDALVKRNVQVSSPYCRLCEDLEESCEHLFIECRFASEIWNRVASWCKLPPIFLFSLEDLMILPFTTRLDRKMSKIVYGILMTCVWCVWKFRNEAIFPDKRRGVMKAFEDIRSLSYLWVKNRAKLNSISWRDWCIFDFVV
ncbi:putative RNA-directed DNA polymerase [Helianthus annuus]|nr:putative RNA-directed DNA polymerase [Helianthus annuus]